MRPARWLALLLGLLAAGCHHQMLVPVREARCPPPRDVGSLADVHTQPGSYPGFTVTVCEGRSGPDAPFLSIVGQGTVTLPQRDPALQRLHAELQRALQAAGDGLGFGISEGCGPEPVVFRLYVRDYRRADEAIRRLGELIRERDLGMSFVVLVMAQVCLD